MADLVCLEEVRREHRREGLELFLVVVVVCVGVDPAADPGSCGGGCRLGGLSRSSSDSSSEGGFGGLRLRRGAGVSLDKPLLASHVDDSNMREQALRKVII